MTKKTNFKNVGVPPDPRAKVTLVLTLDSAFHAELSKTATARGLSTATYAKQLLHSSDMLQLKEIMTNKNGKFRDVHFDQHVVVANALLESIYATLGRIPFTDKMLSDWAAQPSPVSPQTTCSVESIKAETKAFRQALKRALKNPPPDLLFAILTFVIVHRPITSFDGNVAPAIPDKYHPSRDKDAWEVFAENSIAYAIITTEGERHPETFIPTSVKRHYIAQ